MALGTVAIGGERRAPDGVTSRAGVPLGFRGAVQSLPVVDGLARLREDLGMAGGAVAINPVDVFLVREGDVAIARRRELEGLRRSSGSGRGRGGRRDPSGRLRSRRRGCRGRRSWLRRSGLGRVGGSRTGAAREQQAHSRYGDRKIAHDVFRIPDGSAREQKPSAAVKSRAAYSSESGNSGGLATTTARPLTLLQNWTAALRK